MRILHISDFHIDDPNGENENLRLGYYEEFIDNLFREIQKNNIEDIDLIIHTGDFVNEGKMENFFHAKNIVEYFLKKTNLKKSDIAMCIGNHDFKKDDFSERLEKIKPYQEFSKEYNPGKLLEKNERAELYNNSKNKIQILIIDNSSRNDGINEPVPLTITEEDDIIKLLKRHNTNEDIIVLSHYPMVVFPLSKYSSEDTDWTKNHVWQNGQSFQNRISDLKTNSKVIFLCGDGHIPDAFQSGNKYFLMTGLLGGKYTTRNDKNGKPFFLQTQVRILEFSEQPNLLTFNYKPNGFDYDVRQGTWSIEQSHLRSLVEKHQEIKLTSISRTNLLSKPLEEQIIQRIKREGLYKIGRFVTSSNINSLSWISINRLLEEDQILISIIDKSIELLKSIVNEEKNSLIIGIDFHGSIIGTNISIRFGSHNHCLTSRDLGLTNEKIFEQLINSIDKIPNISDIIFTTDVVSSGETILNIINEFERKYEKFTTKKLNVKYHCISIISDNFIIRNEFDKKINTITTACGSLRMPILKSEELPSTDILPSQIDFTN